MKALRNTGNRGFGLIEVLIAAGLLAGLGLAVSQLLSGTLRGTKNIQSKSDFESLVGSIKLVLGNNTLCASSLMNGQNPPTVAHFDPVTAPAPADQLAAVGRPGTIFAQIGQNYPTFRITRLELTEIDPAARTPDGPARTRYLANLRLDVNKTANSLVAPTLTHNFVLLLTADNATDRIVSCAATGQADSQLVTAPLRLTKSYANCDANSAPPGECYCGGLETVHRANPPLNPNGSPYGHNGVFLSDPFNRERPRAWIGEAECPDGYVAGTAGADCGPIAGTGKLENILPLTVRRVRVSCCAYTADNIANGAIANDALKLICYKAG